MLFMEERNKIFVSTSYEILRVHFHIVPVKRLLGVKQYIYIYMYEAIEMMNLDPNLESVDEKRSNKISRFYNNYISQHDTFKTIKIRYQNLMDIIGSYSWVNSNPKMI